MDKKKLSERDICSRYITPAIKDCGWDQEHHFREEVYLTKGRVIVRGKLISRGKQKFADYVLYHRPHIPIAVIEAKDNKHTIGDGMQQALTYAEMLDVPVAFSSNGDGFLEHDKTISKGKIERKIALNKFPTPEELWNRYCVYKGIQEKTLDIVTQDYHSDVSGKEPRYYQLTAVNRTIEAIAKGQNRILLVMATGTGKTYVAFQIIWRLWKSRTKKRILFLADRNILVDQAKNNDFKPFGQAMTKITQRKADPAYEIYLSLYQAVTGTEEEQNIYKEFSREFFDLIIVDECHRGSAAEDSQWREILDYFSSATHIGLTATPKETKYVSNIHYFGDPVYTYSLRQGIDDGFLAPYRVIRIDLDKDIQGWRPEKGKLDKLGREIEDRIYNQKDFDRNLILEKRTELVAKKVSDYLKAENRFDKTIVFCEDIDHAERMRQCLSNENQDLVSENHKYIMRITGDSDEGKMEMYNFILPYERYPVIATTSKLLSTGVDVQTCKLIVLDQTINSMTAFKQIIGRGTRINEDYDKYFFTIIDFRKATELFADPDFDGDPVKIYEPGPDDPPCPPDDEEEAKDGDVSAEDHVDSVYDAEPGDGTVIEAASPRTKYIVGDVPVYVMAERVQYYGKDGKLITESLRDYTKKTIKQEFRSLKEFLKKWNAADRKQAIIEELEEQGLLLEPLREEVGKEFDPFDLICHVAYDRPPLTRKERAENVKKRDYFAKYGEGARSIVDALLEKYADEGAINLDDIKILQLDPLNKFGTPMEIVKSFGGKDEYTKAVRELTKHLYESA